MKINAIKLFLGFLFLGSIFFSSSHISFAETTPYKSAGNVYADGYPAPYTNIENCTVTDGLTCDRVQGLGYANLYFFDFGDFGIPVGSVVNAIRIRVVGKANIVLYVGALRADSNGQCQSPSDKWRMGSLYSPTLQTYEVRSTTGVDFVNCFSAERIRSGNFYFRINRAGPVAWSANIDNFEIAFDYTPPAPTPTPTPPEPFLDLPWDYQSQGFDFNEVVFNPGSWFDHEYPLQNVPCCEFPVSIYNGELKNDDYRSHSGYDYSAINGVFLGTEVLASADGWAKFKPESQSGGAGNVIKIDHGNGYQTWYEHLSGDELVVSLTEDSVYVTKGQKIGKVGMTGNTTGPHIHLSVFKDANDNGTFNDDYPWGLIDPLGWEGDFIDPWTLWESGGRNGTQSYNLFIARAPPKEEEIPVTGGQVSLGDIIVDILNDTFNQAVRVKADFGPFEIVDTTIKSVMPSIFLDAFDSLGQKVTQFLQPVTITYDYADADLLNINEDSLKIYWFNEISGEWEGLPSIVDTLNKTVSSQTTHFSQFALMGELKDLIAPTTEVDILGEKGQEGWYRSDVSIALNGEDNEGGVGILYTLYTINGSDWFEYKDPVIFTSEGQHTLTYQSFDRANNNEERKSVTFSIDKTPPEAEIKYNPDTLDLDIIGDDNSGSAIVNISNLPRNKKSIKITDQAGNILELIGKYKKKRHNANITIESLRYNQGSLISAGPTKLFINYALFNNSSSLRRLKQGFTDRDEVKIKLIYSAKTDITKAISKIKGQKKVKEKLPGIRILKLTTENGTLMYSY